MRARTLKAAAGVRRPLASSSFRIARIKCHPSSPGISRSLSTTSVGSRLNRASASRADVAGDDNGARLLQRQSREFERLRIVVDNEHRDATERWELPLRKWRLDGGRVRRIHGYAHLECDPVFSPALDAVTLPPWSSTTCRRPDAASRPPPRERLDVCAHLPGHDDADGDAADDDRDQEQQRGCVLDRPYEHRGDDTDSGERQDHYTSGLWPNADRHAKALCKHVARDSSTGGRFWRNS